MTLGLSHGGRNDEMPTANILLISSRRLTALFQYLRVKPFDSSTPEGRASERQRRATLTFLASLATQGVKVLTVIISVPLAISYLGTERYGLWLTVSSFAAFLSFSDFGVGNGLLNAVASANGRDDRAGMRRSISSAVFLLVGVACSLGLMFWLVYPHVSWQRVFNVSSAQAAREAGPALAVFVACFLISMPFETVNRVQEGLQEGFRSKLWQAGGSLASLVAVIAAIQLKLGLPWLVLCLTGVPIFATLINSFHLYGLRYPWLRPRWSYATRTDARRIGNVGILFFLVQISMSLAFASDSIVIAQIVGPAGVAQYGVPQRLFGLLLMFTAIAFSPLWPAYGEALSRNDTAWAKRTLLRTLKYSFVIIGPIALGFVVFGKLIIRIWVGPSIDPTFLLLLGFGVWVVISSAGTGMAMFLNGAGRMRFQVFTAMSMAISNLILSIYLTTRLGVPGPIWGSVISYTAVSLIPTAIYMRRILKKV